MRNNKLLKFIIKRVLILILILAIIILACFRNKLELILGLLSGGALGIIRFVLTDVFLKDLLSGEKRKTVKAKLKYILLQVFSVLLLALSTKVGVEFFITATLGVLLENVVVMINSLTETFGFTRNNFE